MARQAMTRIAKERRVASDFADAASFQARRRERLSGLMEDEVIGGKNTFKRLVIV
jgi:hypothetical protein